MVRTEGLKMYVWQKNEGRPEGSLTELPEEPLEYWGDDGEGAP